MPETIREYGLEGLAVSREEPAARDAHAAWATANPVLEVVWKALDRVE